jgi:hypothetical protein
MKRRDGFAGCAHIADPRNGNTVSEHHTAPRRLNASVGFGIADAVNRMAVYKDVWASLYIHTAAAVNI